MTVAETRRRLGRFGVWIPPFVLLSTPVAMQRRELVRIERLGYGSVWSGETPPVAPVSGREAFTQHGLMLATTDRITVGTGIANISVRAAGSMHTGAATLAEAHPDRFVLGLGGQSGERPLAHLRDYLDAMDDAGRRLTQLPAPPYPRVLAALGPRAHQLARERADGVHPFLQPVAHTAVARAAVGPDLLVIPHQAVVLETDAPAARARLRRILSLGAGAPESPYTRNYRRLGYSEAEVTGERSDRLIDDVLAWGDETTVAARLTAHLDAGADHVLVNPFAADLTQAVDQLERLAPLLFPAV
ncbi:TIGR03620 family F420-dependent LLM class oxidoreductase [Frankia sp. AgPm24]|uniref:TIGR03620 family F420-dependent LLM class oxidoreductase n=1 Tax=Frankia sp. AgPm24 TaxID=631128 RepID=UPI00200F4D49|nr:TIGR03620 family F420-dependent LLM class oxidoreductase [Frankia sp. AgPm24]MCK9921826.1 TIGR03620 family F420-dependent LLM class oxidoreductase [Frankia sp. AgPm24]